MKEQCFANTAPFCTDLHRSVEDGKDAQSDVVVLFLMPAALRRSPLPR